MKNTHVSCMRASARLEAGSEAGTRDTDVSVCACFCVCSELDLRILQEALQREAAEETREAEARAKRAADVRRYREQLAVMMNEVRGVCGRTYTHTRVHTHKHTHTNTHTHTHTHTNTHVSCPHCVTSIVMNATQCCTRQSARMCRCKLRLQHSVFIWCVCLCLSVCVCVCHRRLSSHQIVTP